MDEQQSIPSVAETIAAFRGISTERTHDEQYNQEIYTQVIRQLIRRVDTREERIYPSRTIDRTRIRATPDDIPRTGNEVTKRLALAILPAFKQKLKSLPLLMSPSNFSTPSVGFEAVLSQLAEIDEILDQIDGSIMMIWRTWKPRQDDNPSIPHLCLFKMKEINDLTRYLLKGPFSDLLYECDGFFEQVDAAALPLANPRQIDENWNNLARHSASATEDTDTLIRWIQKPLLTMAKARCQKLVLDIEHLLHEICYTLHKSSEWESNKEIEILSRIEFDLLLNNLNNLRRDGLPIFKLCRVFFNKISRPTNSQMLIFVKPSIELKSDDMKEFLHSAQKARGHMLEYKSALLRYGSDLDRVARWIYNIRRSMIGCCDVLDSYWDSLLASKDPEVNRELIEDCQRWLQSWIVYFILATSTAMNATGRSFSQFPGPGDEPNSYPDNGRFDDDGNDYEADADHDEDDEDKGNH